MASPAKKRKTREARKLGSEMKLVNEAERLWKEQLLEQKLEEVEQLKREINQLSPTQNSCSLSLSTFESLYQIRNPQEAT